MDPYNSSYNTDNEDDKPYHCSPAYDEDDIVCLGSESEETAEEVSQKHQRYEAEAQRCSKGQLPNLQSAHLKGPFETGWVNPWRYRPGPAKKQNQDWWQPESEDMLFTRAKVMERAAANGFGYLQPADALSWCKATAKAEADIIHETNIQSGEIIRTVERDDLDYAEDVEDASEFGDSDQVFTPYTSDDSDSARYLERPEISMLNHQSKTLNVDGLASSSKVMKRPAGSQWLKGSYVSKRARWDGPAAPSPTPFPNVLNRDHGRRQLSARTLGQGDVRTHKPSRLSKNFPGHIYGEAPGRLRASVREPVTPQDPTKQLDSKAISAHERTSGLGCEYFGHQPDDLDELQDNSQEDSFQAAPHSSIKSKKIRVSIDDRSFSDLEPDDLIAITPSTKTQMGKSLDKTRRMLNTNSAYDLPEPPPREILPHKENEWEDPEEDSFITEVAPSSRNLEKFEFRKRRPKKWEPSRNEQFSPPGQRTMSTNPRSTHPNSQYVLSDNMHNSEENPTYLNAPTNEPLISLKAPPLNQRPLVSSQDTPPKSDRSGTSWDLVEDVNQTSLLRRATEVPQTTSPPKSTSSISASPIITPRQVSAQSLSSSHKARLPLKSLRKGGKPHMGLGENRLPPGTNDMSTQSFTTTPPGPMVSPVRQPAALLGTQHPHAKASTMSLVTDKMDKIPLALSQICPSSSRRDTPHNSPGRGFQEDLSGDNPLSKGEPNSTDSNRNPTSPSQVGRAPGLPDIEFTDFANESFLFLGGYLSEPLQAEALVAIEDEHQTTAPVVGPESQSHKSQKSIDDVPREEDTSSEYSKSNSEILRISQQIFSSAAVVPMSEARLSAELALPDWQRVEAVEEDRIPNQDQISTEDQSDHVSTVTASQLAVMLSSPQILASMGIHDESDPGRNDRSPYHGQSHPETDQVENGVTSTPVVFLQHRTRASTDPEIRDGQSGTDSEDCVEGDTQAPDMGHQANERTQSGPFILVYDKAGLESDTQSHDPTEGSEASWQVCDGPQSPWAEEKIGPLSTYALSEQVETESPQRTKQKEDVSVQSIEQDNEMPAEETSWITTERPPTPADGVIKPFKDFSTPTPSPERRSIILGSNSVDTQSLVDAALRNPWTGDSKARSSAKARKRVSFGIMPLDEEEDAQRERRCGRNNTPRSPPAQAEEFCQDEDIFHDGITVTTAFNKHFMAATRKRQFKRILPETRGSQLDTSPALLGAQAEAFIAADHAIAARKWSTPVEETPSRYLKARSGNNTKTSTNAHANVWNEIVKDDTMLNNSFYHSPKERMTERMPGRHASLAGFDMASALGEAGDFLEDWSVDAVLKNPKEPESSKRIESNGMRRRRLFGLL